MHKKWKAISFKTNTAKSWHWNCKNHCPHALSAVLAPFPSLFSAISTNSHYKNWFLILRKTAQVYKNYHSITAQRKFTQLTTPKSHFSLKLSSSCAILTKLTWYSQTKRPPRMSAPFGWCTTKKIPTSPTKKNWFLSSKANPLCKRKRKMEWLMMTTLTSSFSVMSKIVLSCKLSRWRSEWAVLSNLSRTRARSVRRCSDVYDM